MSNKLSLLLDLDGVLVDVQADDESMLSSLSDRGWESIAIPFYKANTKLLPNIHILFQGLIDLIDKQAIDVYLWTYSVGPRALAIGKWLRMELLGGRPLPIIHRDCGCWSGHVPVPHRWGYGVKSEVTFHRSRHYVKDPRGLVHMPVEWLDDTGQLVRSKITIPPSSAIQVDDDPGRLRRSPHGILVPSLFEVDDHTVAKTLLECIQRVAYHYQYSCSEHTIPDSLRTCGLLSQKLHRHFQTKVCDDGACSTQSFCGTGTPVIVPGYSTELFTTFTLIPQSSIQDSSRGMCQV